MKSYKFNLTNGKDRKNLANAICLQTMEEPKYHGVPEHTWHIGDFTVDRHGVLRGAVTEELLAKLYGYGFVPSDILEEADPEPQETVINEETLDEEVKSIIAGAKFREVVKRVMASEATTEEPTATDEQIPVELKISVPCEGWTETQLDNLYAMVASKAPLIKTALDIDDLAIIVDDKAVTCPWFRLDGNVDKAADVYAQFITALCDTAKEKKRVIAKEKPFENPKFTMRVWLIGLGLIGDEYKLCRKLMLHGLSGNGAWRFGDPAKKAAEASKTESTEVTDNV
jgi:hypothetical protein